MTATSGASAARRLVPSVILGLVTGPLWTLAVAWQAAVLLGWDATALLFLGGTWVTIGRRDADGTRQIARREDPSVALADTAIVVAGVACLGAVALVLIKAGNSRGVDKALLVAVGVASVALSWAAVHTIFTLRYARIFYSGTAGGIDFNEKDRPTYVDFAYMAFTIGMTFQVSDTDISSKRIRSLALRHALISYLFGAVIVALTINVVASLLH
ncbi:MAG: DUF1345 domain-containing protein [Acidimicrobiales bacterium]